jgi:acyl dehydratase
MALDIGAAVGAELPSSSFTWTEDDIILYNIALGAGNPPTSRLELRYAYEGDLQAVPTYGTIPPFGIMMGFASIPGLEVNLAQILHGDQELTVHRPIPTSGSVTQAGRLIDVYDKGRGALAVLEIISTLETTGEVLFTNRSGIFIRDAGGFGGRRGPDPGNVPPDRIPDLVVESPTLPQQALLYRMSSGDKNPLHADPGFAAFAGYESPILHGLCTYGIVAKAVVDNVLEGDADRFQSYKARFTGHVFPGETLITRVWDEDSRLVLEAKTKERETTVLANAAIVSA